VAGDAGASAYDAGMAIWLDVYRYRELFANLFRRELKVKYKGSVLGVAWSLANPLALVGVYTLVFSIFLRVTGIEHYPLFVVSGLLTWVFFQTSVQSASSSLLGQAELVKQVRFPRQLLPLSVVATNLVTFAVMLAVILPINLAIIPETRSTFWAAIPLSLTLVALASGLAVVVACVNVFYRDVEHLVSTGLVPLFFLTPVFYTFDSIPGAAEHETLVDVIRYGNPLTPVLESIRDPLFAGRLPSVGDTVYAVVAGLASLTLGAIVFKRADDQLAAQL
jgi:ABC-type polysaccharide/polyol phosphate export permease